MQNYKVHVNVAEDKISLVEFYATVGKVTNEIVLGAESPVTFPDDLKGNFDS